MEISESPTYLVETERESKSWLSKGVVWCVALAASLVVDFALVAGAVCLARRLWA
jgi:hypothetical protein